MSLTKGGHRLFYATWPHLQAWVVADRWSPLPSIKRHPGPVFERDEVKHLVSRPLCRGISPHQLALRTVPSMSSWTMPDATVLPGSRRRTGGPQAEEPKLELVRITQTDARRAG